MCAKYWYYCDPIHRHIVIYLYTNKDFLPIQIVFRKICRASVAARLGM